MNESNHMENAVPVAFWVQSEGIFNIFEHILWWSRWFYVRWHHCIGFAPADWCSTFGHRSSLANTLRIRQINTNHLIKAPCVRYLYAKNQESIFETQNLELDMSSYILTCLGHLVKHVFRILQNLLSNNKALYQLWFQMCLPASPAVKNCWIASWHHPTYLGRCLTKVAMNCRYPTC